MTDTVMSAAELCSARDTLGLTDEKLAASLGLPPNVVSAWTDGRDSIPRHIAREIRWRAALVHQDRMLAESGLPICEWFVAWEATPVPGKLKERLTRIEELNQHVSSCPTCMERDVWVKANCPLPEQPLPLWVIALRRLGALSERLPVWARPAVSVGAAFGAYSLFRILFLLPRIASHPRDGLIALAGLALSISIGAAIGLIYGGSKHLWSHLQAWRTT